MSKIVTLDLTFQIQETAGGDPVLQKSIASQEDTIAEYSSYVINVPISTTNMSISLAGITTASTLFLQVDNPITIRLNSITNTAITVNRNFLLDGAITSIHVTNASATLVAKVELTLVE